MSKMDSFIIIRDYIQEDKLKCDKIIKDSIMENVTKAFIAAILKEITIQLIVLISAMLFIFVGVPFKYCFLSIPIVFMLIYMIIYTSYWTKMIEMVDHSKSMHSWVAEACEPYLILDNKHLKYKIMTKTEAINENIDLGCFRRTIVGTLSVEKHKLKPYSLWLHKFAIDSRYRRKGVGKQLILASLNYSKIENYETLECVVTECQEIARNTFLNCGFQFYQLYHKKFILANVEKYHFGYKLATAL